MALKFPIKFEFSVVQCLGVVDKIVAFPHEVLKEVLKEHLEAIEEKLNSQEG